MQKKILVIYHRADFDGEFCREIARQHFGDSADYIGWDYGDRIPRIPDGVERLYMLDISVKGLMDHPKLIWVDHHKSAMEEFSPSIPGYRIDGVAACRLAWQWFAMLETSGGTLEAQACFGGEAADGGELPTLDQFSRRVVTEPLAVRLAGEYDVWDKRDPRVDLFQHGLRSQAIDWSRLFDMDADVAAEEPGTRYVHQLLEAGEYLAYAAKQSNARTIREIGFDVRWEGLTFLAANIRGGSLSFSAGIKPHHDGLLGFRWVGDKWKVSLYGVPGKPDIDLSAIAVRHGGGGHRQACGFGCAVLPFAPGLSRAAADVVGERMRQKDDEGYDAAHDAQHDRGELAAAAASYAMAACGQVRFRRDDMSDIAPPSQWPWAASDWKLAGGPRRTLVKAGGLLLAEIERLDAIGPVKKGDA